MQKIGGRRSEEKTFTFPFNSARVCVPSSCWITRDGKERKIHLLRTNLPISFPFLKRSGGEIKPTERLLLSTGPRAFFFHQEISFHFSSCSYFFFFISENFTERLTGKEYRSMVLRPNSPKCSKRYLDRWNLPIAGRSSTYAYLRLTKCLVIVSVVYFLWGWMGNFISIGCGFYPARPRGREIHLRNRGLDDFPKGAKQVGK